MKEIESVVVSPSIPYDHITIIELKKKGIKVIGEINIAWEILKDTNWIGITGTNGKTTVVSLLSQLFSRLNIKVGMLSTIQNRIINTIEVVTQVSTTTSFKTSSILNALQKLQVTLAKNVNVKNKAINIAPRSLVSTALTFKL